MRTRPLHFLALTAGVTALLAAAWPDDAGVSDAPDYLGMRVGGVHLQSAGALTFGPSDVLFIADSRGATLYALDVAESGKTSLSGGRTLIDDLDLKVAAALGTTRDKVRFGDMARHPRTGTLYFSVARLGESGAEPAIVRAKSKDQIEVLDLGKIRYSKAAVPGSPALTDTTNWGQPKWRLAMTDLAFVDGELWIAGLSNEQFNSALRRLPFPFSKEGKLTTVEVYHTSHDRWETAAPITAFMPIVLDGTPSILAGYGCSPVAIFRRSELAAGGHRKGRTVAELGGGNRPIDMIRYENKGKEWILVANNNRTLMRLDPQELAKAPEMTMPVKQAFQPAGVGYLPVASTGVMQIEDYGPEFIAVMQRDTESGAVNVVTYGKEWL
jgi:hypothetical protein